MVCPLNTDPSHVLWNNAWSQGIGRSRKNDLVPALVHKKKFDCVPRSNHETCMKCFNWKFTKNMIEFPFPLMKYELVRELSFIDCVLPIPCMVPTGLNFIEAIGTRISEVTGQKRSSKFFLFADNVMAVRVQRGNVISVLGTAPTQRRWTKYSICRNML